MHVRTEREIKVVNNMINLYCKDNHNSSHLCEACEELNAYAIKRLVSCPFEKDKPACVNCTNHCYNKNQQKRIKEVMRYSGPKMLTKYPKDTILYFYTKLKYKNYKIKSTV